MKKKSFLSILLQACLSLIDTSAFSTNDRYSIPPSLQHNVDLRFKSRLRTAKSDDLDKDKSKCKLCPEPEMDRKEAAFAMLGTLWSAGVVPSAVLSTFAGSPEPAEATFGEDAKVEIPNMMESMNNRVNNQCLVESLGNRECLVYLDPGKKIYQGAESEILIERLERATAALAEIPSLANDKKWSKVQGVLTGPMNPLGITMDKLSKLSENEENCCRLEKIVKNDLYAITAAVERKDTGKIIEIHEKTTKDLIAYAKAL